MGLFIAFLISFFSFDGDATYHRFDNNSSNNSTITSTAEFSARPATGGIYGPILVIEDIHFKPGGNK